MPFKSLLGQFVGPSKCDTGSVNCEMRPARGLSRGQFGAISDAMMACVRSIWLHDGLSVLNVGQRGLQMASRWIDLAARWLQRPSSFVFVYIIVFPHVYVFINLGAMLGPFWGQATVETDLALSVLDRQLLSFWSQLATMKVSHELLGYSGSSLGLFWAPRLSMIVHVGL